MSKIRTEPFNLERALKGEPVVTRDGSEVKQLTLFDTSDGNESLAGVLGDTILTWYKSGAWLDGEEDDDRALFMVAKEPSKGYMAFGVITTPHTDHDYWAHTGVKGSPQHALNAFKKYNGVEPDQVIEITEGGSPKLWEKS